MYGTSWPGGSSAAGSGAATTAAADASSPVGFSGEDDGSLSDPSITSSASCRKISRWRSVKVDGSGENTSRIPTTRPPSRTEAMARERSPRERQASASTRSSVSVSSQRRAWPSRRHSPEIPELSSRQAPRGGAISPARARQITEPLRRRARAAPEAPVALRAASVIRRSMESSSVSATLGRRCAPSPEVKRGPSSRLGTETKESRLLVCGIVTPWARDEAAVPHREKLENESLTIPFLCQPKPQQSCGKAPITLIGKAAGRASERPAKIPRMRSNVHLS